MSSSTFVLSHGSILEWKAPERAYFRDAIPFPELIAQFKNRDDLPEIIEWDGKKRLLIEGEYQISAGNTDRTLKVRPKIPFDEVEELIKTKLPAAMDVFGAPLCNFWLRGYRDTVDSSINMGPIIELAYNFAPHQEAQESWLAISIDRATEMEIMEMAARMNNNRLLEV